MPLLFDYACLVSWIGPISWLTWFEVMTSNYEQKILPLTASNGTNLAMCFMHPKEMIWILDFVRGSDWLTATLHWTKRDLRKRPSGDQKRKICHLKFARSKLLANYKWEWYHESHSKPRLSHLKKRLLFGNNPTLLAFRCLKCRVPPWMSSWWPSWIY